MPRSFILLYRSKISAGNILLPVSLHPLLRPEASSWLLSGHGQRGRKPSWGKNSLIQRDFPPIARLDFYLHNLYVNKCILSQKLWG